MPSLRVNITLIFVVASGFLVAGFFLSWYPHSIIESIEAQLNQGGLTQAKISELEGSLIWWNYPGILYYESASNVVKALGILAIIYAVYIILRDLRG
jgi:hypothetical protein